MTLLDISCRCNQYSLRKNNPAQKSPGLKIFEEYWKIENAQETQKNQWWHEIKRTQQNVSSVISRIDKVANQRSLTVMTQEEEEDFYFKFNNFKRMSWILQKKSEKQEILINLLQLLNMNNLLEKFTKNLMKAPKLC